MMSMGIQELVMVLSMRIGLLDGPPDRLRLRSACRLQPARKQREQLVRAVRDYPGRDLRVRELFENGMPAELMGEPAFAQCERLYFAGGDGTVHLAVEESIPTRQIGFLQRGTASRDA